MRSLPQVKGTVECTAAQSYVPSDRIGSIGGASSGGGTTIFHIDQATAASAPPDRRRAGADQKSAVDTPPKAASRTVADTGNTRGRSGGVELLYIGAETGIL